MQILIQLVVNFLFQICVIKILIGVIKLCLFFIIYVTSVVCYHIIAPPEFDLDNVFLKIFVVFDLWLYIIIVNVP